MYLHNMYVFPLVKMESYLNGYFIDAAGNVFSNKTDPTGRSLTKLMGSKQPSGHYYTLNKRSFRADDLIRRAKNHPTFNIETGIALAGGVQALAAATKASAPIATYDSCGNGRTKSAKAMAQLKGFVLVTVGPSDRFIFGTDPVLHLTEQTARDEAGRIAALKPGTEVVILKAVASVTAGATVWK